MTPTRDRSATASAAAQGRPSRSAPTAMRPPRQQRSRESWERILVSARELLEEGGWEALTITEVCARAGVSAPTIYARVDGLSGLFAAVYEQGMRAVDDSERAHFAEALETAADSRERVEASVLAICTVFREHDRLLRSVIRYSSSNPGLLSQGAVSSRRVTTRVAELLPGNRVDASETARMLYAECVLRVMYGDDFLTAEPEVFEAFVARLTTMAVARLAG